MCQRAICCQGLFGCFILDQTSEGVELLLIEVNPKQIMAPGGNLLLFDACSHQKCIRTNGPISFFRLHSFIWTLLVFRFNLFQIFMVFEEWPAAFERLDNIWSVSTLDVRCQLLHHQHSVCLVVLVKQVKKDLETQLSDFSAFSTFVNHGNFSTVLTQMSFVFACLQRSSHLILARFDIRSFNKNWDCALNDTKI